MKAIKVKQISKLLDRYPVERVEEMVSFINSGHATTEHSGIQVDGEHCLKSATASQKPDAEERRKYFRIPFPLVDRPVVTISGHEMKVVDLSEGGLRAKMPQGVSYETGQMIQGELQVFDGTIFKISGRVVRKHEYHLILEFTELLPFSLIMRLQRHLLNKYELKWSEVA